MGFLTKPDSIGALTYSSGVITLQPSRLTIGGQQYRTPTLNVALSGLTANTLYMLFVVMTGPSSFQLVVSANYNSVGPVGYTRWKLVGAFYSNGVTGSIAFGAFVKSLLSSPVTEYWDTSIAVGNVPITQNLGKMARNGEMATFVYSGTITGAASGYINFGYGGLIASRTSQAISAFTFLDDSTQFRYDGSFLASIGSGEIAGDRATGGGGPYGWGATNPVAPDNNDKIDGIYSVPISGWSTTPLAYL